MPVVFVSAFLGDNPQLVHIPHDVAHDIIKTKTRVFVMPKPYDPSSACVKLSSVPRET
jgi:dTDP-4-dehydrorhamnose 3,5-epimerase-like enzyme